MLADSTEAVLDRVALEERPEEPPGEDGTLAGDHVLGLAMQGDRVLDGLHLVGSRPGALALGSGD